jgi:hypothetical protein
MCGIGAWVIYALNMPQPFKTIAFAILAIIVVVAFFQIVLGVNTGIPIK